MLQYIRDKITAVYLTDATGLPTQVDMLDADGVSLLTGSAPVFQVPNAFAVNHWSLATGPGPKEITINVSVLPAANGSPITAIQYRVGTGAWVTLDGTGTGARTVTMQATSTAYDISLRAVNIVGAGNPSTAKSVTSGAPAATAPAAFGPAQWTLATGTEPASLALNILNLPADGGSPITTLEYRVGSGSWAALDGAETGPRAIAMPLASTAYSISLRAVNAVGAGAASAAKTATSGAPALAAPSVETPPSITGPTTVGGILTRTAGTATGNPTPSRTTVWLKNGTAITGQTGNTLDTTGFAVDDAITTRDVWTNSQGSATGTSDPVTLTEQPTLQATITPDPIVMGEPFTVGFNAAPDEVTGSVTLTGSDTTYTGVGPASSPVSLGATKAGYTAYSATITVDTAVITPTSPITAAAMYETQTVGDIPGFATKSSASGYTRTGRTIASVQTMVGRYAPADPDEPDAPLGITDLEPATAATVLDEGDVVIARVTDSGGAVRDFILAETEYVVRISLNSDGTYDVDINPIVPAGLEIPITDGGATSSISRNDLADGEEIHVLPTLTGTAAVGATLTGTEGVWFITGTTATITRSITADGATVHTFDEDDPLEYVVQAGDAGKALRLVEALGGGTAQSAAVNIPAPAAGITQVGPVYENTTSTASRTFSAVDIGAAAAARDIIVLAWCGNTSGTTITGVTVGGVAATLIAGRLSTNSNLGYASAWKARVPTGTTGDVIVTYSQVNAAGAIAILRGVNITVSAVASSAAAVTNNTSVSFTGATVGHDLFAFNAASNGPTTWGAGVTEMFDEQIGTEFNTYATLARGIVGGTGAGTITISRDGGSNSQWATIAFAAGAA